MGTQEKHRHYINFDIDGFTYWDGESKLGFVPRDQNHDLSKFLEMGYEDIFDARIQRVAPEWEQELKKGPKRMLQKVKDALVSRTEEGRQFWKKLDDKW